MTLWLGFLFLKIWKFPRNHQCSSCYSFQWHIQGYVHVCVRQISVDLNFKTDLFYDFINQVFWPYFVWLVEIYQIFYPHQFYKHIQRYETPGVLIVMSEKKLVQCRMQFFLQRLFAEKWGVAHKKDQPRFIQYYTVFQF